MLENLKREDDKSDAEIVDATRKTNALNSQRNALITAIDEAFNKASNGGKIITNGQNTKIYR